MSSDAAPLPPALKTPEGVCGYTWPALVNFASPHRCVQIEGHSGPHRCRCMAQPGDDTGTSRP